MEEAVIKHPHPELFAARLQDLRDARFSRAHFEFIQYCSAKAKRHVQTGRFTNADC
jgi:hypothetical protein